MASGISYEARPTFRDLAGRFTRADEQLIRDKRQWAKDEARRFVNIAQRHAPKKTGEFARGIRFRSFGTDDSLGFTTSAPEPLATFIIGGTKPHIIQGRPLLSFFWERVNKQMVVRYVNHPGTKKNPFIRRAYEEWLPGATATFNRISTRWQTNIR